MIWLIYLSAMGRAAIPSFVSGKDSRGPCPLVTPPPIPTAQWDSNVMPRELTQEETLEYIELHGQAAHNAVELDSTALKFTGGMGFWSINLSGMCPKTHGPMGRRY